MAKLYVFRMVLWTTFLIGGMFFPALSQQPSTTPLAIAKEGFVALSNAQFDLAQSRFMDAIKTGHECGWGYHGLARIKLLNQTREDKLAALELLQTAREHRCQSSIFPNSKFEDTWGPHSKSFYKDFCQAILFHARIALANQQYRQALHILEWEDSDSINALRAHVQQAYTQMLQRMEQQKQFPQVLATWSTLERDQFDRAVRFRADSVGFKRLLSRWKYVKWLQSQAQYRSALNQVDTLLQRMHFVPVGVSTKAKIQHKRRELWYLQAVARYENKQYDAAMVSLNPCLTELAQHSRKHPKALLLAQELRRKVWLAKAQMLIAERQHLHAIDPYLNAILVDHDTSSVVLNPSAYSRRKMIPNYLLRFSELATSARRLKARSSMILASMAFQDGAYDQSETYLDWAYLADSDRYWHQAIRLRRGWIKYELGQFREAKSITLPLIQSKVYHDSAFYHIARYEAGMGAKKWAYQKLDSLLFFRPRQYEAFRQVAARAQHFPELRKEARYRRWEQNQARIKTALYQAENLPDLDEDDIWGMTGTSDPYVRIEHNGTLLLSSYFRKDRENAHWDSLYTVSAFKPGDKLTFILMDHDNFSQDDTLAEFTFTEEGLQASKSNRGVKLELSIYSTSDSLHAPGEMFEPMYMIAWQFCSCMGPIVVDGLQVLNPHPAYLVLDLIFLLQDIRAFAISLQRDPEQLEASELTPSQIEKAVDIFSEIIEFLEDTKDAQKETRSSTPRQTSAPSIGNSPSPRRTGPSQAEQQAGNSKPPPRNRLSPGKGSKTRLRWIKIIEDIPDTYNCFSNLREALLRRTGER